MATNCVEERKPYGEGEGKGRVVLIWEETKPLTFQKDQCNNMFHANLKQTDLSSTPNLFQRSVNNKIIYSAQRIEKRRVSTNLLNTCDFLKVLLQFYFHLLTEQEEGDGALQKKENKREVDESA